MQINKNFFDYIFNTVMNVNGKTKDNEKARMDLTLYCRQKELELKLGADECQTLISSGECFYHSTPVATQGRGIAQIDCRI